MAQLRTLSPAAVPRAMDRADQYRLRNEPEGAESICLDVLEVEPENQRALILLLLARTDQFEQAGARALDRARKILPRLEGQYERAYYAGVICERQALTMLKRRGRRSGVAAYEWFQRALEHYDDAIAEGPAGDESAILRWNTCVRMIDRHPHCVPDSTEHPELGIE
ncbi:MAG: hypothetical protein ACC682_05715 [Gemmatimonadota bacterium]